ncbi:SpoIIE family protein phosphatase [Termitidicoccus mucosus]|uniref:Protein serine phosphatase n=1 Tax=Termitidicoccus mucosus TaxID=1184151 RepID=A0A178IGK3_9BACT|nr:protein serine phosphatase [Opitutaceae bacterium TSB47]
MWFFLTGLILGVTGMALLYYRARRELVRVDEEKQVVTQETQIVVDFMHHMAEAMAETPRREDLHQRIVHASILCTGALSACIFERGPDDSMRGVALEGLFPPHRPLPEYLKHSNLSRAKFIEAVLKSEVFPVGEGVVGAVAATGRGEFIPDAKADPRVVAHDDPALEVKSLIAVPLTFTGRFFGVLAVANPADNLPFTETDFSLVQSLAEQAALALHNTEFLNFQLEKKQLDLDLTLASSIQQMLLPRAMPRMPGIDIDTRYSPAQKVGGDFFDLFVLSETRLGIAVGDVSGKGVAASLLMAICRTNLRQIAPRFDSPARILAELNRTIGDDIRQGLYITVVFAIVDIEYNEVTIARAGHELPYCAQVDRLTGTFQGGFIGSEGMAVGMVDDELFNATIADRHDPFRRGELLMLYTDGITEAVSPDGAEFSSGRLAAEIQSVHQRGAREINAHIMESVARFAEGAPQRDDCTLVTVKRL